MPNAIKKLKNSKTPKKKVKRKTFKTTVSHDTPEVDAVRGVAEDGVEVGHTLDDGRHIEGDRNHTLADEKGGITFHNEKGIIKEKEKSITSVTAKYLFNQLDHFR
jgi:hypothetical protein